MDEEDRVVVDFDPHSDGYRADRRSTWSELRQCPVAFSPRYGGFWVVSGYDQVVEVAKDEGRFSSRYEPEPVDGINYLGITGVPRGKGIPPAGIAEADPVVHAALRRLLNPYLLPPAVTARTPFIEQTAAWFLDQQVESGTFDLVGDFTNPVTAVTTLAIMGLPPDSWAHYAGVFHGTVAYRPDSPEYQQALTLLPGMVAELLAEAEDRRRSPRHDLLTGLVELRGSDGQLLNDGQVSAVLWNLVAGGLDTTSSMTALALHHLDGDHATRRRMIDEHQLLPMATEEYLRYFCVNETLTRTVTEDTELAGQHLRRGEYLMLSWLSADLDDTVFDRPDQLVLDRAPNPHLAFGIGPHRCIGMHLARALFGIMLRQVLDRIPDYRVDRQATTFYERDPSLAGVAAMPVTFDPVPAVGGPRPF
jgi:cytochrome P450